MAVTGLPSQVREGLKVMFKWPTFPQVYANGALVGGLDVCRELQEEGELVDALKCVPPPTPPHPRGFRRCA